MRLVGTPTQPAPQGVALGACLNCTAPLTGPFCAACGQRDVPPYPSVRDLVVDAFWELSGWDGRFASTLRALVQKPGLLTREFLEGRRARYISPLRLYLMASLVYFVLAAAAPGVIIRAGDLPGTEAKGGFKVTTTQSAPERVGKLGSGAMTSQEALTPAQREVALKDIARAPSLMRPFLRKAVLDPTGFKRGILESMPRLLFALLPVFAAIVALFYRGKKYPEHLYFAIHLHAFMFLALGVPALFKVARLPIIAAVVEVIGLLWIPIYATLALRRVYGGSVALTLAKEIAIGALYCTVGGAAFVAMLYWVSL